MTKKVLLGSLIIFLAFLINIDNVFAARQYTLDCYYRYDTPVEHVENGVTNKYYYYGHVQIGNIGDSMSDALKVGVFRENTSNERDYLFNYDILNTKSPSPIATIYNYNRDMGTYFILQSHIDYHEKKEEYLANNTLNKMCPSTMYFIGHSNSSYDVLFCNGFNSNVNKDSCTESLNIINNKWADDFKNYGGTLTYFTSAETGVDWAKDEDINLGDQYQNVQKQKEEVCDENNKEKYNYFECKKLQLQEESYEGIATDSGKEYLLIPPIDFPPIGGGKLSCEGVLGDPNVKTTLAALIKDILNLIMFIAPAIVFVLSVIDFVKAVVAQDADALKKASGRLTKRLIIVIALFFIPMLIDLSLGWFGLYSDCSDIIT